MAYTDINSEDRLVQAAFAEHLEKELGWESVYAWNQETFGVTGTLGRASEREVVLVRDLRETLVRLNPSLPESGINEAVIKLTHHDYSRSLLQHNQAFYKMIRDGVPVSYRDTQGQLRHAQAAVIDFRRVENNRFLAVRELKITGLRTPNYNRRADLVCFVNGLPLVFIELKAVYKNIRAGFDGNLSDYLDENVVAHAFHHNVFLIVSNGDNARYGSITSTWEHFGEWKRLDERDVGSVAAQVLLNGMLAKDRLLDIVENFILFDASKAGNVRKVVARNHQVLGVNLAVESVVRQESIKREFPVGERLKYRVVDWTVPEREQSANKKQARNDAMYFKAAEPSPKYETSVVDVEVPKTKSLQLVERVHPDLGRLGVLWHTQGSGKSYSMAFFTEKVRRTIEGNFTFVMMTDRDDLDGQIYKTFAGCGIIGDETPRASSGKELERLLKQNHRYVFSLIHKFNQTIIQNQPYSDRDDIIVISDEAHRTQSGKLARNMRLALPNAAFIGFTGTPLFKNDELTRRIFGDYVSRYDFRRSEQDGATVKLVYANRGEKLGIARLDLNDKIADAIDKADLNPDETALLEKLLGKDYEIITADARLIRVASDFVDHCSTRWESGKSMLVCIDKITCARVFMLIEPLWKAKALSVHAEAEAALIAIAKTDDHESKQQLYAKRDRLLSKAKWLDETIIEIVISEAQNEVADFKRWGFDIISHRATMKQGFETPDGNRVDVESAFKNPKHPFRVVIVCAMWLTGFDVESLSTLYIDKPMRSHTLMQAIARANRVYPGKDFGLIVDYNGMLKSLREALAKYAIGDDASSNAVVTPLEDRVGALVDAIEVTEEHLRLHGFDAKTLLGTTHFTRIKALADAKEAVCASDDAKRRFEIYSRVVFQRFKALITEPTAIDFAERHDNIEAIYKKLSEARDTSDVTDLLKALHRIVNRAIETRNIGNDQVESLMIDLSKINMERLREEFSKNVSRKASVIDDIRNIVEVKLMQMLALNPLRMNYEKKYQEIIADYNQDKDRATIEAIFARLLDLSESIDLEQRRALEEGLTEEQLALFDLLGRKDLSKVDRERVKQASKELLDGVLKVIAPLDRWTEKGQTQAEVETFVLDKVFETLPEPPYTQDEKQQLALLVYRHIWQQSMRDQLAG
jgi:type I restriction enzyme, R subunit